MGLFVWLIFPPLTALLDGGLMAVLLTVALAAVLYLLLLVAVKALPREDVLMLPKGEKIVKMLKIQ